MSSGLGLYSKPELDKSLYVCIGLAAMLSHAVSTCEQMRREVLCVIFLA